MYVNEWACLESDEQISNLTVTSSFHTRVKENFSLKKVIFIFSVKLYIYLISAIVVNMAS